jgi:hypothetical protein
LERLDPLLQGGGQGLAHCVFSETSSSVVQPLPASSSGILQNSRSGEVAGESVWLSLRHSLFLFLSSCPSDPAPYAFIRLQDAVLRDVDYTHLHLILAGKLKCRAESGVADEGNNPDPTLQGPGRENTASKNLAEMNNATSRQLPFGDPRLPLPLCFLLADGRFQPFDALWLEIQFETKDELDMWVRELGVACDGLDAQDKEQQAKAGGKFTGPKGHGATRAPTVPLPGSPPPSPPVLAEEREGSRPENAFSARVESSRPGPSASAKIFPRPAG